MKRWKLGVVLAVVCFGALGGSTPPTSALSRVAYLTAEAGTARISFSATMEIPDGPTETATVTVSGEGVFDLANGRGRMTYDMPEVTGMARPGLEGMEIVFADQVMYVRAGGMGEFLPQGKRWLRVDLDAWPQAMGDPLGGVTEGDFNDPTSTLDYLHVAKDVAVVGTEEVRGSGTTRYRFTVDLGDLEDELTATLGERYEASLEDSVMSRFPAEAWIDTDGLLRRFSFRIGLPGGTGTPGGRMQFTFEQYDFGVPVDIDLPPAKQVIDIQDLLVRELAALDPDSTSP